MPTTLHTPHPQPPRPFAPTPATAAPPPSDAGGLDFTCLLCYYAFLHILTCWVRTANTTLLRFPATPTTYILHRWFGATSTCLPLTSADELTAATFAGSPATTDLPPHSALRYHPPSPAPHTPPPHHLLEVCEPPRYTAPTPPPVPCKPTLRGAFGSATLPFPHHTAPTPLPALPTLPPPRTTWTHPALPHLLSCNITTCYLPMDIACHHHPTSAPPAWHPTLPSAHCSTTCTLSYDITVVAYIPGGGNLSHWVAPFAVRGTAVCSHSAFWLRTCRTLFCDNIWFVSFAHQPLSRLSLSSCWAL